MIDALLSSESSVLTRATQRDIPEDGILNCRRRENLKSYIEESGCHSLNTVGPILWNKSTQV
jgi:hypothetical protein